MNTMLITGFCISFTSLILMVFLTIYGKTKLHRIWFLMNLVVFIWGVSCFFIGKSTSSAEASLWWRIAIAAGVFTAPLFYHTSCIFAEICQTLPLMFSYIIVFLFAILALFTEITLNKFRFLVGSGYYPTGNFMYLIMIFSWSVVIFLGAKVLTDLLKRSIGKIHLQAKYLVIAFLTGFIGSGISLFTAYDPPYSFIYPFGNFGVVLYSIIGTYAILRHKLMDISIVIKKSLVYSALLTLITALYLIFALTIGRLFQGLFGYNSFITNLLTIFIIVIFFAPLRNKIQSFIDHRFFKGTLSSLAEEKAKLEEELRRSDRLKAVSTLAAGMAHEIKNPLTSIKTFTEYLDKNKDNPEFIDKFKRIVGSEVDKINNIVHQLLDFAKPSPLKLISCDIHQILEETLALLSSDLLKHKIKLTKEYNAQNHQIQADSSQLKQAFLNIILNAMDAMPNGGILTVATNQPVQHNELIIAIKDTGKGISEKDLPHIFDPFFSSSEKGTGLGLSITHGIIKEHSGRIEVESKVGVGSEFRIIIRTV